MAKLGGNIIIIFLKRKKTLDFLLKKILLESASNHPKIIRKNKFLQEKE